MDEFYKWALNNSIGVLFALLFYFRMEKRIDKLIDVVDRRLNGKTSTSGTHAN